MKAVLSRFAPLILLGILFSPLPRLHAQVTATASAPETQGNNERWDFFAGAQYSHFNPGEGSGSDIAPVQLLGWTAGTTLWLRPSWGFENSERGLYGNLKVHVPNCCGVPPHPPMSETLFLFGPTFRVVRTPRSALGLHFLIGAAYGVFDSGFPANIPPQTIGIYNTKLAFGMAWGAFAEHNLTPRVGVRTNLDWQPTHYGFSFQNEFAGSVGLFYKLGKLNR